MPSPIAATRDALSRVHIDELTTDDELMLLTAEVESAGRLVDSLRGAAAAEIVRRSDRSLGAAGLSASHGHRSPAAMIVALTGVSSQQAEKRARLASQLLADGLSQLGSAITEGALDIEAAGAIAQAFTGLPTAIDEREVGLLVDFARTATADEVASAARAIRDRLDLDGAEERERQAYARRSLRIGRMRDGLVPLHAELPAEMAGAAIALFDSLTSSRRAVTFSGGRSFDDRSMDQRRADAFSDIIRMAAGTLNFSSREAASARGAGTLVVTVPFEALAAGHGPARVDGVTGSITASAARRLACSAGILPMVLDGDSVPLDLGRSRRLFSLAQRRLLGERDRGCCAPGCDAPPGWTEAHHILPWSHGGQTDLRNGVLLCSFHHHRVHDGVLEVTVVGGRPRVELAGFTYRTPVKPRATVEPASSVVIK